jgi:hypothetical protein
MSEVSQILESVLKSDTLLADTISELSSIIESEDDIDETDRVSVISLFEAVAKGKIKIEQE